MTAIRFQHLAVFRAGAPHVGYYNDLTRFAQQHHRKLAGSENPVTIAQIGLGAWQLAATEPRWLDVVGAAADRLTAHMDSAGHLPYHFTMPHTYRLEPPWISAMAQGEAASFLLRAARALATDPLREAAGRAAQCLTETGSALVVETAEGPVLQEYPTDPPAHVLNGWIFALWGLYDVGIDGPRDIGDRAMAAFRDGVVALTRRLPQYELAGGWSRYDLRRHGPVNVSSPFYHHLHIQQLQALSRLCDEPSLAATATRWQRALRNPITIARAGAGKIRFRRSYPRRGS